MFICTCSGPWAIDFVVHLLFNWFSMLSKHQRVPEVLLLPNAFLEAWGTKAKTQRILQKRMVCWPCRLRQQGRKTMCFLKMCGFLALAPQASKTPLGPKKHIGIPLKAVSYCKFTVKPPSPLPRLLNRWLLAQRFFGVVRGWSRALRCVQHVAYGAVLCGRAFEAGALEDATREAQGAAHEADLMYSKLRNSASGP